jgi:hypothetical protein
MCPGHALVHCAESALRFRRPTVLAATPNAPKSRAIDRADSPAASRPCASAFWRSVRAGSLPRLARNSSGHFNDLESGRTKCGDEGGGNQLRDHQAGGVAAGVTAPVSTIFHSMAGVGISLQFKAPVLLRVDGANLCCRHDRYPVLLASGATSDPDCDHLGVCCPHRNSRFHSIQAST